MKKNQTMKKIYSIPTTLITTCVAGQTILTGSGITVSGEVSGGSNGGSQGGARVPGRQPGSLLITK